MGFPPDVLAEAERAAAHAAPDGPERIDATDIELVTIDPPGSKDLDQAVGVARPGDGYRVHYAIADLGAVVMRGRATGRRGAPSRADGVPAGRLGAAAPAGAVRGRGQPAPRRAAGRGAVEHRPGRRWRAESRSPCGGPSCAPGLGWTTPACRPTTTPGGCTRRSRACPSWAGCAGAGRAPRGDRAGAARAGGGARPRTAAGPCRCGSGWTSRPGTRRSPCSPGCPRRRSCWRPGSGCCARCRRRSRRRWPSCGAPPLAGHRLAGGDRPAELLAGLPLDTPHALALRRAATTLLRGAGYAAFDRAAGTAPPADPGTRRDRCPVRARHRAAAAAGRPVRHRGLPGGDRPDGRAAEPLRPRCPRCRS